MQFELPLVSPPASVPGELFLRVGPRTLKVNLVRHRRARRYVLRLTPDGVARVTIPRGGSVLEAMKFARRQTVWLEKQLLRQASSPPRATAWQVGSEILFRGEMVQVSVNNSDGECRVLFGAESFCVKELTANLRPFIEAYLRRLAERGLPPLVSEFAARYQLTVQQVQVRNQKSRWGSCSQRGTISLNWRLVQAPSYVRDYIIWHELAHLKQMNHSSKFWCEVARLCPGYEVAERWLKQHSRRLL